VGLAKEKPPPEWGVFRSGGGAQFVFQRLTPTGVGSTVTYHQVVNVLFTMIARIHQPGHPIKNSLRDPP
jgi:hypothetical protein